jgi:hypothetical protein
MDYVEYKDFSSKAVLSSFNKNISNEKSDDFAIDFGDGEILIFTDSNYSRIFKKFFNTPVMISMGSEREEFIKKIKEKADEYKNSKLLVAIAFNKYKNGDKTEQWKIYKKTRNISTPSPKISKTSKIFSQSPIPSQSSMSPIPTISGIRIGTQNFEKPNFFDRPASLFNILANKSLVLNNESEITKREYKSDILKEKLSKKLSLIKSTIEKKPAYRIDANRKTGICTISKIQEDDDFDTDSMHFCAIHSGNILYFEPISKSVLNLASEPYGYFNKNSDCYDQCYLTNIKIKSSSDEIGTFKDFEQKIENILLNIERDVKDINNLIGDTVKIIKDKSIAEQNKSFFEDTFNNELGSDNNTQLIQKLLSDPLFEKHYIAGRGGKSTSQFDYIQLPILEHNFLSSFFGRTNSVINELDIIDIKLSLHGVLINIPNEIKEKILLEFVDRSKVLKRKFILSKFEETTQLTIIGGIRDKKIIFTLSNLNAIAIPRNFLGVTTSGIIYPIYSNGSYKKSTLLIGTKLAIKMDIYKIIENNYNILNYLGAFYLSKFSDLTNLFLNLNRNNSFMNFKINDYIEYDENNKLVIKKFTVDVDINNIENVVEQLNNDKITIEFIEFEFTKLELINLSNELNKFLSYENDEDFKYVLNRKKITIPKSNIEIVIEEIKIKLDNKYIDFGYDALFISNAVVENIKNQLSLSLNIEGDNVILEYDDYMFIIPFSKLNDALKFLDTKLLSLSNEANKENETIEKQSPINLFSISPTANWTSLVSFDSEYLNENENLGDYFKKKSKDTRKSKKLSISSPISTPEDKLSGVEIENYKKYNTTHFNRTFEFCGTKINGYIADKILSKYKKIKDFNLEDRTLRINISSINLFNRNVDYIISKLYSSSEDNDDEDNLSVKMLKIFFGEYSKEIIFPGEIGKINIKDEIDQNNPHVPQKKYDMNIPESKAILLKSIKDCMNCVEKIDKTAILAKQKTIENYGSEIFESIFVGCKSTNISGIKKSLKLVEELINKRSELYEIYSSKFLPFLESLNVQDNYTTDGSTFISCMKNYYIYSEEKFENSPINDFVFPLNPKFYDKDFIYESILPSSALEYTDLEFIDQIESVKPSKLFKLIFKLLFPGNNSLILQEAYSDFNNLIKFVNDPNFKYMEILTLTIKFFEIFNKIEMKDSTLLILDKCENLLDNLFQELIKIKKQANIPSISELNDFFIKLIDNVKKDLKLYTFKDDDGNDINFLELYEEYLKIFSGLIDFFFVRRDQVRSFVEDFISNLYNYRIGQDRLIKEMKNQNFNETSNLFESSINTILFMINEFNEGKLDINFRSSEGIHKYNLKEKLYFFNKFYFHLWNVENVIEFNDIKNAFCYFVYSNSKTIFYERYISSNYKTLMENLGNYSLANFRENQEFINSKKESINTLRNSYNEKIKIVKTKIDEINSLRSHINSKKKNLVNIFIETLSTVDIFIKFYQNQKKSYIDSENPFFEIINGLKLRLDGIIVNYQNINELDIKILLDIFHDNSEIYNVRKTSIINLQLKDYGIFTDATQIFSNNVKYPQKERLEILNSQLSEYDLSLKSSVSDLDNKIKTYPISKQSEIRNKFNKIKIANNFLTLFDIEIIQIKNRICSLESKEIKIIKHDLHPKINGYGDRINLNIKTNIDQFTSLSLDVLYGNINFLINKITSSLEIIDSGPGLHLLSDSIEYFLNFITEQNNENFKIFSNSFKKFIKFSGKKIIDILEFSTFTSFVSIINGKMDTFKLFTSNIPFYNEIENCFPIYEDLSANFVKGFLIVLDEVSQSKYTNIPEILINLTEKCKINYNADNFASLIETIKNFNRAIIPFIDEYVDENGIIINDEQVMILRDSYNLKTKGEFMNRFFEKLNHCVILYIKQQNDELTGKIIKNFIVYVESLNKQLEKYEKIEKSVISR